MQVYKIITLASYGSYLVDSCWVRNDVHFRLVFRLQPDSVAEKNQHKTNFTTPWGTFAYNCMPFSLINSGATFQREMNLSFGYLIEKIIVIYFDDLSIFSRRRKHHLRDLKVVLQRCRDHEISLNPKIFLCVCDRGEVAWAYCF